MEDAILFPVQSPSADKTDGAFSTIQSPGKNDIASMSHDLLEISLPGRRAIAFGADGFKPDGAGLPGHAYEVAGVDVADLPDMHGLRVVGRFVPIEPVSRRMAPAPERLSPGIHHGLRVVRWGVDFLPPPS